MQSVVTAGRKRAAIELIARKDAELRRTARRFSLCEDDAEDAYQRALEILLLKAPNEDQRDLIRWTKTVVKHEALAIRRQRERMLGLGGEGEDDPIERIVAGGAGPAERTERREEVARSREALSTLKPAELRALTLLAAGYSYAEIGEITGFSQTKVNRSLAEGRERFRKLLGRSEDGTRCAELLPLLSTYCDGELSGADEETVREHLRACPACRTTMRAYRATPGAVAALAPALPGPRSLLERAHELLASLQARLPGGGETGVTPVAAAGGTRGAGIAALAKVLAVCAGTAGGAAACVAAGVAPMPLDLDSGQTTQAAIERSAPRAVEEAPAPVTVDEPQSEPHQAHAQPEPKPKPRPEPVTQPVEAAPEEVEAGAVEYSAPPPEPVAAEPTGESSGSAAGEFGP